MAWFNIVNGWPVRVPKSEWTDADWTAFLNHSGQTSPLDDELCTLLADARQRGYERATIQSNRYGWALYSTDVSTGRISPIVETQEEAKDLADKWVASRPEYHTLIERT